MKKFLPGVFGVGVRRTLLVVAFLLVAWCYR